MIFLDTREQEYCTSLLSAKTTNIHGNGPRGTHHLRYFGSIALSKLRQKAGRCAGLIHAESTIGFQEFLVVPGPAYRASIQSKVLRVRMQPSASTVSRSTRAPWRKVSRDRPVSNLMPFCRVDVNSESQQSCKIKAWFVIARKRMLMCCSMPRPPLPSSCCHRSRVRGPHQRLGTRANGHGTASHAFAMDMPAKRRPGCATA